MKYDIETLEFRTLAADEIELRVGTVSAKGATLLLYKDARCDQSVLDETVGAMNWQRHHSRENANCIVSIWDNVKNQWVEKEDTGTESNTEREKGLASDSFKRACTNWGIGRELYTSPFIFVPCATKKRQGGNGYELEDRYMFSGAKVTHITYDGKRKISELIICDKDGTVMFSYPRRGSAPMSAPSKNESVKSEPKETITADQSKAVKDALEATESDVAKFLAYVSKTSGSKATSVDDLTPEQHEIAVKALNKKMAGGNK